MIRFGIYAFLLAAAIGQAVPVMASDPAVVLMYHRFGESTPSTNIRIEQFEAHLEELSREKYTVLPLPEIIAVEDAPATVRSYGRDPTDGVYIVCRETFTIAVGLPVTSSWRRPGRELGGFVDQIRS